MNRQTPVWYLPGLLGNVKYFEMKFKNIKMQKTAERKGRTRVSLGISRADAALAAAPRSTLNIYPPPPTPTQTSAEKEFHPLKTNLPNP